jgi:hypothetical protein
VSTNFCIWSSSTIKLSSERVLTQHSPKGPKVNSSRSLRHHKLF